VSRVYLIRHAQAGPRHQYDRLSELGLRQARLLGERLASEGVVFSAVYTGDLERQKLTARTVQKAYHEQGFSFPDIAAEPQWNEFDLDEVYRQLAPELCRDDPVFRRHYEQMLEVMGDESHAIHRNHSYCDIEVVRAWVAGRYPFEGESWKTFRARVIEPRKELAEAGSGRNIAVFTSGTPLSVWAGAALELNDRHVWRLAGAAYNTGITTLRVSEDDLRLFTFNAVPHLIEPNLRTFR